jgi:hypothetical protein
MSDAQFVMAPLRRLIRHVPIVVRQNQVRRVATGRVVAGVADELILIQGSTMNNLVDGPVD